MRTKFRTLALQIEAGLGFDRAAHKEHMVTRENQATIAQAGFQVQVVELHRRTCQLIDGDVDLAVELGQGVKQQSQVNRFQVVALFRDDRGRTE